MSISCPSGGTQYEEGRKEGNVLFNDALNTFDFFRLYGVGHMVKNHSDCERGNPLPPHGLLLPINSNNPTTIKKKDPKQIKTKTKSNIQTYQKKLKVKFVLFNDATGAH